MMKATLFAVDVRPLAITARVKDSTAHAGTAATSLSDHDDKLPKSDTKLPMATCTALQLVAAMQLFAPEHTVNWRIAFRTAFEKDTTPLEYALAMALTSTTYA